MEQCFSSLSSPKLWLIYRDMGRGRMRIGLPWFFSKIPQHVLWCMFPIHFLWWTPLNNPGRTFTSYLTNQLIWVYASVSSLSIETHEIAWDIDTLIGGIHRIPSWIHGGHGKHRLSTYLSWIQDRHLFWYGRSLYWTFKHGNLEWKSEKRSSCWIYCTAETVGLKIFFDGLGRPIVMYNTVYNQKGFHAIKNDESISIPRSGGQ